MVNLIKPNQTKIITKEGECQVSITLDLNINLNSDGLVLGVSSAEAKAKKKQQEEDDEVNWAIPDFGGGSKINFGKDTKE